MGHQGTHCVIIKRDGRGHPMISGIWLPTKRMYIFSPPLKKGMPRIVLIRYSFCFDYNSTEKFLTNTVILISVTWE